MQLVPKSKFDKITKRMYEKLPEKIYDFCKYELKCSENISKVYTLYFDDNLENLYKSSLKIEELTATQPFIDSEKLEKLLCVNLKEFPPILVRESRNNFYIEEGHTRARLFYQNGKKEIEAVVFNTKKNKQILSFDKINNLFLKENDKKVEKKSEKSYGMLDLF